MDLKLNSQAYTKCNTAILLSGCARSGTTILGKILHSFKNVEYSYEPPLFSSLFPLINDLSEKEWKLLYETYLYDEFLMESISGRNLNFNKFDDSFIGDVKSKQEIKKRMSESVRKIKAEKIAKKSNIAYKIPNIIPFIPKIIKYYPKTRVVITVRQAPAVIKSLLKKNWFSDKALKDDNTVSPTRAYKSTIVPAWVNPKDDSKWNAMDELHRCAYYYIEMNKTMQKISNYYEITYTNLLENPRKVTTDLAKNLKLLFGSKTQSLIKSVDQEKKEPDNSILGGLDAKTKQQVLKYSNRY